ncbi:DJ-1/PfpI family protein [Blastopirellula sp. J2-11]|uniref:GlxA family transcriptional regulator n=1 Tax=Blastopirellula sp. J2-11 TaxID=2943192 RepID=UPI0021C6E6DF|nr:DJ-1/PfpI family protein [Blastopirellula sp. J2-11]UUO04791.1 DJ-1/PfpI family protein [Blastopirellula sp. J2-11]
MIVAPPQVTLMDVTGPWEVFCRAEAMIPGTYDVAVIATEPGARVSTKYGLDICCERKMDEFPGPLDTVLVAGSQQGVDGVADPVFLAWLQDAASRTRRIGSVCTGVFYLAQAGLLVGRRVTSHWRYIDQLKSQFPDLTVDPEPIFVRDRDIYTSAGIAAGIDLALALVEQDCGHAVSQQIAHDLVIFVQRHADQTQLSWSLAQRIADHDPIRQLQRWAPDNLPSLTTVDDMAAHVHMSPRNFSRLFKQQTGMTPGSYLRQLRAEAGQRRMQQAPGKTGELAAELGFGCEKSLHRAAQQKAKKS